MSNADSSVHDEVYTLEELAFLLNYTNHFEGLKDLPRVQLPASAGPSSADFGASTARHNEMQQSPPPTPNPCVECSPRPHACENTPPEPPASDVFTLDSLDCRPRGEQSACASSSQQPSRLPCSTASSSAASSPSWTEFAGGVKLEAQSFRRSERIKKSRKAQYGEPDEEEAGPSSRAKRMRMDDDYTPSEASPSRRGKKTQGRRGTAARTTADGQPGKRAKRIPLSAAAPYMRPQNPETPRAKFPCDIPGCSDQKCSLTYGEASAYDDLMHFRQAFPPKMKKSTLTCVFGDCAKTEKHSYINLERHFVDKHLGITFQCPACEYDVKRADELWDHMRKHHPEHAVLKAVETSEG
ncbi:hypothetical protein K466DRAFT_597216 [Polyporus arcularius HHB13444]|uniref:C2H2-type domain-containing protein n=1 Tax=Polyporus arcularius HHB13444 TaxID=1314778 RepID=A0A5C3PMD1_9APHY|nr:hypothetical protein K466DRAFT_597216 [Polyporus arcularius HHB13444]